MKISELLQENEPARPLSAPSSTPPSAPSLDDEPEDIEGSEEDDETSTEDFVDSVKSVAGSLGKDLYSITVYNTGDNFANIEQDIKNAGILEQIDDPVVQSYLRQGDAAVGNEKAISCLIMNSRNGQFILFNSGEDGRGLDTDVNRLTSDGVIDVDQVNVLRDIDSLGKKYNHIVNKVSWRPGTEAEGRNAEMLYNILDRLKAALSLKEPVDRIKNVYISPEQRAKNKAMSDEIFSGAKERIAARKAARAAKEQGGTGRELR